MSEATAASGTVPKLTLAQLDISGTESKKEEIPALVESASTAIAPSLLPPSETEHKEPVTTSAVEETPVVAAIQDCSQLYDPCTREPVPNMAALEKRIREIKKQSNVTPVGLYGLTNATSNYEFLTGPFLDKSISLDDMVSFRLQSGGQIGSDMFEVLSRLFVFFGGIADVNPKQGGNYRFMEKIEALAPRIFTDPRQAFQEMKCKASSKYGVSDITLVRIPDISGGAKTDIPSYCESECSISKEDSIKTYLMSVKWYNKEKNAEYYDLEKLQATAEKVISAEGKPYGIIVFLKSKLDFDKAHQRASRQYIRHIGKTYFGWEEDVKPFLQDIRRQIFEEAELRNKEPKDVTIDRYFIAGTKPTLNLQLHQEIITHSVCNAFGKSDDNRYLIGVLPRGGKTYIAGGIIREYLRRSEARSMNIVWLTAAPNETRSQVGRDLIQKFSDFDNFDFIDVRDEIELKSHKPFSFFFCSTQLLTQRAAGIGRKNRLYIDNLLKREGLGMIFYDEAHKTATGTKTREEVDDILKAYESIKLPLIFLTATYYNILFDYRILPENTFIWDYTDVLKMRGLATETEQLAAIEDLKNRFKNSENPELVTSIIDRRKTNGESVETLGKPYLEFPELYFISADFQEEAIKRFDSQSTYSPDKGFDMKSIFAIRPDSKISEIRTPSGGIRVDAFKIFNDLINPRNMISLITPDAVGFSDGSGGEPLTKEAGAILEPTILGRINSLSRTMDSRFRLDQNPTLMMFMPTGGVGSNIYYTLCAWASLLMSHPWWKARYEVMCVVDSGSLTKEELEEVSAITTESSSGIHIVKKDPKAEILTLERKLHCPESGLSAKGLVILAGQKLSMGVSLPCTDVVFLFNDSKSPDDIIQKMYRGLTPSIGKKAAFVVDLNPVRSFAAVYGYTRAASRESITKSDILDILYDTYSWDSDVFDMNLSKGDGARPQTFQQKLRELFDKAERDPGPEYRINEDFGGLERRLGTNIRSHLNTNFVSSLRSHFTEKRGTTGPIIELRDGATATMKSGRLIIRKPIPEVASANSTSITKSATEPIPDTTEIVIDNFIETVSDFVKYLAITSSKRTLDDALTEYEDILNTSFKRNVDQLLYARADMKGIDNITLGNILTNAVRNFSLSSSGMVFNKIKGEMDDTEIRKDKILNIIHKRLTPRQKQKKDHGEVFTPIELIEDMLSHLPASDWSDPNLKWLDPANGIGNFPVVVFYKLDEGLKKWEPNEKKRRKHIIENMLYMMELQSNNNRIARNIFTSLCNGCTPNIWTVDTDKTSIEDILAHFKVQIFDRVIGNPPFQAFQKSDGKRGGGDELYMKFVKKSIELLKPNGYLVFVHPPSWRKPEFSEGRKKSKNSGMFELMAHDNQIEYLEIHSSADGIKVFKAGTRYDFYTIKKIKVYKNTTVKDINGNITDIDLRKFDFLPNSNIKNVQKLLPTGSEVSCDVSSCIMYSASDYESRRDWVSPTETSEYKYPLIHATNKDGARYMYSSRNDRGFFGISKVIFGDSGINNPVIDLTGKYGMTQHAMAIAVKNKTEADTLVSFLKSNFFTNILNSCMWSGFQIDWRLFTYFKQNFWNIDVDLNESLNIVNEVENKEVNKEGGSRRSRYNKTRKVYRF